MVKNDHLLWSRRKRMLVTAAQKGGNNLFFLRRKYQFSLGKDGETAEKEGGFVLDLEVSSLLSSFMSTSVVRMIVVEYRRKQQWRRRHTKCKVYPREWRGETSFECLIAVSYIDIPGASWSSCGYQRVWKVK